MPSRRSLANAIRALSMDAVQRAKFGHPEYIVYEHFGLSAQNVARAVEDSNASSVAEAAE